MLAPPRDGRTRGATGWPKTLDGCTSPQDEVLDRERLEREHKLKIDAERFEFGEDDESEFMARRKKRAQREVYGEIDRPEPAEVIADMKDKFVEWDIYKMSVMKNLIDTQKKTFGQSR